MTRLALLLPLALAPAFAAHAQRTTEDFSAERLRPATDRDGIFDVEWAVVEANPHEYDVALVLNYALNPLVLNLRQPDGQTHRVGALIAHRVGASVVGDFAVNDWLTVGGELPFVPFQVRGGAIPGVTLPALSAVALGDARLMAKVQIWGQDDYGVGLAVIPAVTVPTAFPQKSLTGEAEFTAVPEIAVSRDFDPLGLKVAANVGARFRPETTIFGLDVNHELTWRVGAAYKLPTEILDLPLTIEASLNGGTSLVHPFRTVNTDPMELLGGAAYEIIPDLVQITGGVGVGVVAGFGTPDLRVFAALRYAPRAHDRDGDGVKDDDDECIDVPEDRDGFEDEDGCPDPDNDGDGILDGDDRCPNVRGTAEFKGCLAGDADGDGILDKDDKCPTEPEDFDQFEDEDGCPDPDNDGDGIKDGEDKCPNDPEDKDDFEDTDGCPDDDNDGDGITDDKDQCKDQPEDYDGDKDDDGCPDNAKIVVTKKKVFTLEKIYFDFNKATIKQESKQLIDDIAKLLKDNPELGRIRIEGHTDSIGSDAYNLQLSQARTDSVRKALIERAVPPERLLAIGFGESKPISDNGTAAGREKNRRVEFLLMDQAPPPTDTPPADTPPAPEPAKP